MPLTYAIGVEYFYCVYLMLFGFRILVVGAVNFSISALTNQLHLLELRE